MTVEKPLRKAKGNWDTNQKNLLIHPIHHTQSNNIPVWVIQGTCVGMNEILKFTCSLSTPETLSVPATRDCDEVVKPRLSQIQDP